MKELWLGKKTNELDGNGVNKFLTRQNLLLCTAILSAYILPFFPNLHLIASLILSVCMAGLFFDDEFYLLYGIFPFFYTQFIFSAAFPVQRIYSIMLLVKIVVSKRKIKWNVLMIPSILMIIIYCVFILGNADTSLYRAAVIEQGAEPASDFVLNMKIVVGTVLDVGLAVMMAFIMSEDKTLFRRMFWVMAAVAVASGLYGLLAGNSMEYNVGYNAVTDTQQTISRSLASFVDPNVAGFFLNIMLFAVFTLKMFKHKYVKWGLFLFLYYFILSTGSMTALLCNVLCWSFYIVLKFTKLSPMILFTMLIAGILGYFLVTNTPVIKDISVIQNIQTRVENQFIKTMEKGVDTEDSGKLTSGRADAWQQYLEYFDQQEPLQKLFGGNVICTNNIDPHFLDTIGIGTHEAYIQLLLDFGILGVALFLLLFLLKFALRIRAYFREKSDVDLMICLCSFLWICYGFTIDFFPDWKFLFFYFL